MLLQQRLASGSQASCSYITRPVQSRRAGSAATPVCPQQLQYQRCRPRHVCRVAEVDEAEELELEEMPDTPYERMVDVNNIYPDFENPEWAARVTDWEEFWHEEDDVLGVDDEDPNAIEVGGQKLDSAYELCEQLADVKKRNDVEQLISNQVRPKQYYDQMFTSEEEYRAEMSMMRLDPNPPMTEIDARALAEKRRTRAMFDAEWERQTALLSRSTSFTLRVLESNDFRFESTEFDWVREQWTHEQIEDLIVGGGKFVHPSKIPVKVLNPLVPVDFAESAVRAIPDTEDFIRDIGHMATEDEIMHLQKKEIRLEEKDFVDPTLVFDDAEGLLVPEAPINRWAELQKYRDQVDLELFEQVVDKMAARQRKAEARRAAREAELAGEEGLAMTEDAEALEDHDEEEEGEETWMDEIMGLGYSEFMQEDDTADVVYADYEDGDEEAAEQEEEGVYVVP